MLPRNNNLGGGSGVALRNSRTAQDAAASDEVLRDLMQQYQSGDGSAVEELVRQLSPRLLGYFVGSLVPRADAEDLLQECWLRIHRSRHTYRSSEPVLPGVFAVARHTQLDWYRRRQRRSGREVSVREVPDLAQTIEPDRKLDVMALLKQLPESQRAVLVMLKVSEMSLEEIARATASSVGSVKQKAHRAYAKLRELLATEGEG